MGIKKPGAAPNKYNDWVTK